MCGLTRARDPPPGRALVARSGSRSTSCPPPQEAQEMPMPTDRTANDEARAAQRQNEGGLSPGVAIVGFVICFVAGAGIMWGVDARLPRATAGITADTAGAASKQVSANAVRVDLHVMAQCPYGVQAEAAFKDVVSKLGPDLA